MAIRERMSILIVGLVAPCLLVAAAGCTGATSAGTPYTLKIDRELRSHVMADLYTTHSAALEILADEFLFTITHEARDAREGVIVARTAKNRGVRVETYKVSDDSTVVDVFVGPLGDLAAEVDIFHRIEAKVGGVSSGT